MEHDNKLWEDTKKKSRKETTVISISSTGCLVIHYNGKLIAVYPPKKSKELCETSLEVIRGVISSQFEKTPIGNWEVNAKTGDVRPRK